MSLLWTALAGFIANLIFTFLEILCVAVKKRCCEHGSKAYLVKVFYNDSNFIQNFGSFLVPSSAFMVATFIHSCELLWASVMPQRLLYRLGLQASCKFHFDDKSTIFVRMQAIFLLSLSYFINLAAIYIVLHKYVVITNTYITV